VTDPVDPARRAADLRAERRRDRERKKAEGEALNLPVPAGERRDHAPEPPPAADATFAAQLMGQGGQKRGLKGGPEVLDQARATYLGTEYSGPNDRRPQPGRNTRTKI